MAHGIENKLFRIFRSIYILRNNKIIILNEATVNVDSKADNLVRETIRRQFADCKVIMTADRSHMQSYGKW